MSDVSTEDVLAALHPQYASVMQSTNAATLAAGNGLQALAQVMGSSANAQPSAVSAYAPVGGFGPAVMQQVYVQGWKA